VFSPKPFLSSIRSDNWRKSLSSWEKIARFSQRRVSKLEKTWEKIARFSQRRGVWVAEGNNLGSPIFCAIVAYVL
jgi:hypothetical protein